MSILRCLGGTLSVGVVLLAVACGKDRPPAGGGDTPAVPGPDGGSDEGDASDGAATASEGGSDQDAGDGGVCNTLEAVGALVAQTAKAGARPSATGGELVTGIYALTARAVYGDPPDTSFVERVLSLNSDTRTVDILEGKAASATGAPALTRSSNAYRVNDSVILTLRTSCPGPPDATNLPFTAAADGTTITLFPTEVTEETYTLQP
jgi:hypothetical protein